METMERKHGAEAEFTQNLKDGIESAVNEMIARGEIQDYSAKAQEAALHAAITAIQKAQDFTDRVGPFPTRLIECGRSSEQSSRSLGRPSPTASRTIVCSECKPPTESTSSPLSSLAGRPWIEGSSR